jgi:hypothetical protein
LPSSDALTEAQRLIISNTAAFGNQRRVAMAGVLSEAGGLENCQVIWRGMWKEARGKSKCDTNVPSHNGPNTDGKDSQVEL